MWQESIIRIADDMAPLSCAVTPAHPWVYGLGQSADSGGYLSPANALAYLAKKLVSSGATGDVIILMIAENTHDAFIQGLSRLSTVFPAPAFTQVSRMAKAAAELSTVKMQLPAKVANALPAAAPLSVSTNRAAVNAQRVAAAQLEAAVSTSTAGLQKQMAAFVQARAGLLSSISQGLDDLKGASAPVWAFTHSGDHNTGAVELLKNIPQATAVHTAAMMFTGDPLTDLEKMLHEPDRATRP
ncbi:hypothetical protein [Rahnella aceris]|uniref:hypothetical protein n=1 Tax=Rahnella sp. (strain Y9602) TaxID=2703885 RepID=UPI001C27D53D|nr:hypothetical protein [Rahnella aceris]MBU9852779.1 hypothetical protein [Rahnella aceris]